MRLGKHGEGFAKKYFESLGYEFVSENYRYERAETDLIFKDDVKKLLVFVEVKTRRSKKFGEPEESITEKKMEQMIKSAQGFLMTHEGYDDYEKRFDIAAIMNENGRMKINHIENAF
ncbi:MAG: YraN family protein [Ignavibacteria bacterium]|nr:YraN family protein [Ignavibacteria bacterium]